MRLPALILALSACTSVAFADEAPAEDPQAARAAQAEEQLPPELVKLESSLVYKRGDVVVGDDLATLRLGNNLRYLDPRDTEKVLVAWGNPPGSKSLGMVLPGEASPFDQTSWAVLINYIEEGHVEDDDAKDIDFTELLSDMKSSTEESNAERQQQGYPAVHLVGWAEPPRYDAQSRKLYWAKELDFGSPERTLNYDIRVLGRKGVLELSAIASMAQLSVIKAEMPSILSAVEFNPGMRYADFQPGIDNVAAYGIGALVAGKLAAKAGLFKVIITALLAAKKLVVAGLIGLAMLLKKLLTGRKSEENAPTPPEQPAA